MATMRQESTLSEVLSLIPSMKLSDRKFRSTLNHENGPKRTKNREQMLV